MLLSMLELSSAGTALGLTLGVLACGQSASKMVYGSVGKRGWRAARAQATNKHGISLPPFFVRDSPVDLPEVSDLYLAGALETSIAQTFETFACVCPNLLLALCP